MPIFLERYSEALKKIRASFVTLYLNDKLRGCIGTLSAHQPLIKDIVHNAYTAAFGDPRFFPITEQELKQLTFEVSILSELEPITFDSEIELLNQLKPHIDGLVLIEKNQQGTFLPSVWDSLPSPKMFLEHLKAKAGLPTDYWSTTIQIKRYTTTVIKS
jgi:AmmeMemoRadiSam system protein A